MEETTIDITSWIEGILFGFVGLGVLIALLGAYYSRQGRLQKIADMEECVKMLREDTVAGCRYCRAWGSPPEIRESCTRKIREQLPEAEDRLRKMIGAKHNA